MTTERECSDQGLKVGDQVILITDPEMGVCTIQEFCGPRYGGDQYVRLNEHFGTYFVPFLKKIVPTTE